MIFDHISNISAYAFLGKNFETAVKYLENTDLASLAAGHYDIDGEKVYANIFERELTQVPTLWEVHKKYADIQLVIAGSEILGCCPLHRLHEQPVFGDNDCAVFNGLEGTMAELQAGEFIIAMPQDVHQPNCPGKPGPYSKKMVVKVLLE